MSYVFKCPSRKYDHFMSPLKKYFFSSEIMMYLYNFPFTFNKFDNIGKFLYIHWPLVNPASWDTQSFWQSPCILYDDHRWSVLSEQMKPNNQPVLFAYMCWCVLLIPTSRRQNLTDLCEFAASVVYIVWPWLYKENTHEFSNKTKPNPQKLQNSNYMMCCILLFP